MLALACHVLFLMGFVHPKLQKTTYDVRPCTDMYKPQCKHQNESHAELSQHLKQALNNKIVAIVGDSLTRQWIETLSCFMGESIHWGVGDDLRYLGISPLHVRPKGAPQNVGAWAFVSGTDFIIEYYHLDRFNTRILPYLRKRANLTVVNIGVHYHDRKAYITDMRNLFYECVNPHCVFRETLPQHFRYSNHTKHNGAYLGRNGSCGKINGRTMYAEVEEQFAADFNQSLMKVRDAMRGLYNEHVGSDCTHYCSDTYVWKHLHKALLDTLLGM